MGNLNHSVNFPTQNVQDSHFIPIEIHTYRDNNDAAHHDASLKRYGAVPHCVSFICVSHLEVCIEPYIVIASSYLLYAISLDFEKAIFTFSYRFCSHGFSATYALHVLMADDPSSICCLRLMAHM